VISITIPGKPVAKARPFVTKAGVTFTPKKTANWEAYAKLSASQAMQGRPATDRPVKVAIAAFYIPAASWPKWKREKADAGEIAHTAKPDIDNIAKACKDALNGVVWMDDSQVIRLECTKSYSDSERVEITVTELDLMPSQAKTKEAAAGEFRANKRRAK
jgi:Holliday junction resolvase RusA-like endonuclease